MQCIQATSIVETLPETSPGFLCASFEERLQSLNTSRLYLAFPSAGFASCNSTSRSNTCSRTGGARQVGDRPGVASGEYRGRQEGLTSVQHSHGNGKKTTTCMHPIRAHPPSSQNPHTWVSTSEFIPLIDQVIQIAARS